MTFYPMLNTIDFFSSQFLRFAYFFLGAQSDLFIIDIFKNRKIIERYKL